ncbi:MAG TPA: hypothetical protein VLM18_07230 [Croceibacterium sp.]|nr:hypothetical protein [Croceibacterium sp.]
MSILSKHRQLRGRPVVALGVALFVALNGAQAWGATQGSLGATSQGSIAISASVPSRARITGLTDVSFANQDPSTAASSAQNVCVWSNTATNGYTITATGSGTSSAFTLTNGAGIVPYSVEWAATSGQTSGSALVAGTASSSLTSGAVNQTCSSAPLASASLIVKMSTTDLSTMIAGSSYTGTLTLLVTPQ